MDSEVTVTVQGLSAERVGWWLDRLREIGLVPAGGGRVRETIGRPGHFMARSVPTRTPRPTSAASCGHCRTCGTGLSAPGRSV